MIIYLDRLVENNGRHTSVSPDLLESMRQHGQLEPILVYPARGTDTYTIKDGRKRVMAARTLGWDSVWAIQVVEPETEATLLIQQYEVNTHRNGFSYADRARLIQTLHQKHGLHQAEIARQLNVNEATVSLSLSLLEATPELLALVEEGRLEQSAVRPLLSLPQAEQKELLPAAIQARTARGVAKLVEAHKARKKLAGQIAQQGNGYDDVDPMEQLAVAEVETALQHLESASQMEITYPPLREYMIDLCGRISTIVHSMIQ